MFHRSFRAEWDRRRMAGATYLKRLAALWLALPVLALNYFLAWNRLPERVPMKFGPNGAPTAWAARGDSLTVPFGVLGFTLVLATVIGVAIGYQAPERMGVGSVVLGILVGFVTLLFVWIVWAYQVA